MWEAGSQGRVGNNVQLKIAFLDRPLTIDLASIGKSTRKDEATVEVCIPIFVKPPESHRTVPGDDQGFTSNLRVWDHGRCGSRAGN